MNIEQRNTTSGMSETYQSGETVDVTIQGARVAYMCTDGTLCVRLGEGDGLTVVNVPVGCEQATIERVIPAEGPVRAGDVWRDRDGSLWFARNYCADHEDEPRWVEVAQRQGRNNGVAVALTSAHGGPYGYADDTDPEHVSRKHGPLTLVYRDPGDELAEIDTTEEEIDAMLARGVPVEVTGPPDAASAARVMALRLAEQQRAGEPL